MTKVTTTLLLCLFVLMVTTSWANVNKERDLELLKEAQTPPDEIPVRTPPATDSYTQIPYDWVEINPAHPGALPGTNTGITSDDQYAGPFPLGFTFPWYDGQVKTEIRVCSNGFLSFGTSTSTYYTNYALPYATGNYDCVAPYWDDMNISSSYYGSIWYYSDPGGQFFVVEYDSCNHFGSTITGDYFTFEAILYPNGNIEYQYKAIVPGTMTPFPSATVGMQNSNGTIGEQTTYNGSGPLEPTSGMGILFDPVGTPQIYDIVVDLTYLSGSPVPAAGGNINFDLFGENEGLVPAFFDGWLAVEYEGGNPSTVMSWILVNYLPGWTANRPAWFFPVPNTWAAGNYTFWARVGDEPGDVWDESGFPFIKSGTDHVDGFTPAPMTNLANPFEHTGTRADITTDIQRRSFSHPNPFNPTTTISYEIMDNSRVNLSVFDIHGRQVASLVDGWRHAGTHSVVFDATNLASGIYIYRLEAGNLVESQKLILVK